MEMHQALAQVEAKLLALDVESRGLTVNDGTKIVIGLWEPNTVTGVRVSEVSFVRKSEHGQISTGWLQSDLEGLLCCAAVERCILARVLSLDEVDVENADACLSQLFQKEQEKDEVDERQGAYVRLGGTHCPFCDSEDITGAEVNIDAGTASQEVSCNSCDEEWHDLYQLEGFQGA